MKKTLAVMLAALMIFTLFACGKKAGTEETPQPQDEIASVEENETPSSAPALGAWTVPESPEMTGELLTLFAKAADGLVGAEHVPVAYIGRQAVSGLNHAFICREKIISPGTAETYSIVYIYEDTNGKSEIKDIVNTGVETWISDAMGGWTQAESPVITDELAGLLKEALEGLLGADYSPVALLSTQVVAGMNYCVLCEQTVVYPGAEPEYVFVYMYVDLDGEPQITDIVPCAGDAADAQ